MLHMIPSVTSLYHQKNNKNKNFKIEFKNDKT